MPDCPCDHIEEVGELRRCTNCGMVYTLKSDGTLEPLVLDELDDDDGTDQEKLK